MKYTVIINCNLGYTFNVKTPEEAIVEVENVKLPKECIKDSLELVKIIDKKGPVIVKRHKPPILKIKKLWSILEARKNSAEQIRKNSSMKESKWIARGHFEAFQECQNILDELLK